MCIFQDLQSQPVNPDPYQGLEPVKRKVSQAQSNIKSMHRKTILFFSISRKSTRRRRNPE